MLTVHKLQENSEIPLALNLKFNNVSGVYTIGCTACTIFSLVS